MPLLDHFHPPLSKRRHWHSFHNAWATYLSADINRRLPTGYFAEPNVQFGIEIDVATFEESSGANALDGWNAPPPVATVPFAIQTDHVEVLIYRQDGGPRLAGAIELISPANKDRPAQQDAFVAKCLTYLERSVGLVVVDVVTDRRANLHAALMARIESPHATAEPDLYVAAYRRIEREGQRELDVWLEELTIGKGLPTVPLWLPGSVSVGVDLETTYARTCSEQRVPLNGV